jgi:hypothetical protein
VDTNLGAPGRTRNGMSLADPVTKDADHTYANFSDRPLFAPGGPAKDDLVQGGPIADCYWMSTLAAVAKVSPDRIRQLVVDLGDGTYAVHFRGNAGEDQFVRVDADLPTDGAGSLVYAREGAADSIWAPVVEKAWTFFRDNKGTYASVEYWGTYLHMPYKSLDVTVNKELTVASFWNGSTPSSALALLNTIKAELASGLGVIISGPHPLDTSTQMIGANFHSGAHAYMVESVNNNGTITIRNPYATQGPNGDGYTTIGSELAFYACYNFTSFAL